MNKKERKRIARKWFGIKFPEDYQINTIQYTLHESLVDAIRKNLTTFSVDDKVFCTVHGFGEVFAIESEHDADLWPVGVVYNLDLSGEYVVFYNQKGESMETQKKTLFKNKNLAEMHITLMQPSVEKKSFERFWGFFNSGLCIGADTEFQIDRDIAYLLDEKPGLKLVRKHRVIWSN